MNAMTKDQLIDTKQIAQLLGVTRAHAVGRIIKRQDFPKPVIDVSQRLKKWSAQEVLRWARPKS